MILGKALINRLLTKKYRSPLSLLFPGLPAKPWMPAYGFLLRLPVCIVILPSNCTIRCFRLPASRWKSCWPFAVKNWFPERHGHTGELIHDMPHFAALLFKKFRRAGTLNRNKVLHGQAGTSRGQTTCFLPHCFLLLYKCLFAFRFFFFFFVLNSTCATAAIRSQCFATKPHGAYMEREIINCFDLEWHVVQKLIRASVSPIPLPLSITCTRDFTGICNDEFYFTSAPSTAFSNSSFTALAGRWMTSTAAIWLAILSGERWSYPAQNQI